MHRKIALAVSAYFSCVAISYYFFGSLVLYNNSILHILSFGAIYYIGKTMYQGQVLKRILTPSISLTAAILSLLLVIGQTVCVQESIRFLWNSPANLWRTVSMITGLFFLFNLAIHALFQFLSSPCQPRTFSKHKGKRIGAIFLGGTRRSFLCLWFLIFAAWIPVLLAYYPGIHSYDVFIQFPQALGTQALTAYHPIAHTVFIRLFVVLGEWVGSRAFTLVSYSVAQMLILSAVFAYTLRAFRRLHFPKWLWIASFLFFTVNPYISIFSILQTKDVLFGGFFLLFHVLLLEEVYGKAPKPGKWRFLFISAVLLLSLLFRNNAVYAILLYLPCVFFIWKRKALFVSLLIPCVLMLFLYQPAYRALGIEDGPQREMLSVPLQQIALVANNHREELPEDELEKIGQLIAYWQYNPRVADPIKDTYQPKAVANDTRGYIDLWLKYLGKYPVDYVDAFLNLNLGFWYADAEPQDRIHNRGYLSTGFRSTEYVQDHVARESKLPWLMEWYDSFAVDTGFASVPLFSSLFSIGLPICFIHVAMAWCFHQKLWRLLLLSLPSLFLWLTFLAGPIAAGRYVFPFMLVYPVLMGCLMVRKGGVSS